MVPNLAPEDALFSGFVFLADVWWYYTYVYRVDRDGCSLRWERRARRLTGLERISTGGLPYW